MKAFLNPKTDLYELKHNDKPVPNMPSFRRFVGGIGYGRTDRPGDMAKTWLVLFGEAEDLRIWQLIEFMGTLQAVGKEAINLKDRFLCGVFYVDASDVHNQKVRYLRTLEGLTFYKQEKGVIRPIHPTDTATWPHFRGSRPLASVAPVLDDIRADIDAGFSLIRSLATDQRQLKFYGACEKLADRVVKSQVKDRKPEEALADPLVNASVFAVSMLLRTRPVADVRNKRSRVLYPNRKR